MKLTSATAALALDAHDKAILQILQRDNKVPQREIGEAVNLSAPAVQRRIARLEAEGVIQSNIATVDPLAVGQSITVLVEVTLVSDRSHIVDAAKATFREAVEIQQCYCVTGVAGFVVIMLVPSMSEYEERARRLFADNENVKSYRSTVVLDRVKVGLNIEF